MKFPAKRDISIVLAALFTVALCVGTAYVMTTCHVPPTPREQMELHLGPGAVCSEPAHDQATCIRDGRRFTCVFDYDRVACQEQP